MANLTAEELDFIKQGAQDYTKVKIALGDLELKKQELIARAEKIQEKVLIEKYGADAVINTQTGEVTHKEKK
jgi:hypothetical protein